MTFLVHPASCCGIMPITSLSDSTPSTTAPTPSARSHSNTGRIIGGVAGGIGGGITVIGVIATLFLRRKKHQKKWTSLKSLICDHSTLQTTPRTRGYQHSPDTGRNTTQNSTFPSSTPIVLNDHGASVEQVSGPNVIAPFSDGQLAPLSILPRSDVPQSLTDRGIRIWQEGVSLSRTNSFATTAPEQRS